MTLQISGHTFAYEMENILRLFHPGAKIVVTQEERPEDSTIYRTTVQREADGSYQLMAGGGEGEDFRTCRMSADTSEDGLEKALARLLYAVLAEQTGKQFPWGILTGVRPAALYRRLLDDGRTENEARRMFAEEYLVSAEKTELTLSVAEKEAELLGKAAADGFSLYISIPFCPSRCLYCSFVSHDIAGVRKLVPDYIRLLCEEIRATGELAKRRGHRLQTVYIGGGTPTSLEASQLEEIMTAVEESFSFDHLLEYTVEAGRPDTVTPEKLAVLRQRGADRVSINPQTMDDEILRRIGRNHTAEQTERAFQMAREAGFPCINMDLIVGLPRESGAEFQRTMDKVLSMSPENITIHVLTVKRSSRLREQGDAYGDQAGYLPLLLEEGGRRLRAVGYAPYYLYRQKGTVGNLENTGYSLSGQEGLYNVLIMEEVQTILAVGAGAVTKLCAPGGTIRRVYNYKYPYEYISRFEEILRRKSETELILEEMP